MEKYLKHLLENNTRIIIPDFGALIVKEKIPLTIVFNEFLQYNDGMLVNYVSKEEGIKNDEARKKIEIFVKEINLRLNKGERYPISNLGDLVKNSNGKISLELPSSGQKTRIKPSSKAQVDIAELSDAIPELEPEKKETVSIPTIEPIGKENVSVIAAKAVEEKPIEIPNPRKEFTDNYNQTNKGSYSTTKQRAVEKPVVNEKKHYSDKVSPPPVFPVTRYAHKRKKLILWTVSVVILNVLIFGYLFHSEKLPGLLKMQDAEESDADSLQKKGPAIDNVITNEIMPGDTAKTTVVPEQIEADETKAEISNTKNELGQPAQPKYYVVAGGFQIEQNADKLVKELREEGFNAQKFGKMGKLHLVCYGVLNSREEADQLLKKVQIEINPGAWVKKEE